MSAISEAPQRRHGLRRWWWLIAAIVAVSVAVVVAVAVWHRPPPQVALPLWAAGEIALPGDSSRFDYASLDPDRDLLFVAHQGASEIVGMDVRAGSVVRVIHGIDQVHGVLVIPPRHRVYATATGANHLITLNEDTGEQLSQAPTGDYTDWRSTRSTPRWTTNETGGSETVVGADSRQVRGTVQLGGEAGNVAYDPSGRQNLVDVQTRNELSVIDPASLTITRRVPLPGCEHPHGPALDPAHRLAFVACDANATLLTIDLDTWHRLGTQRVGDDPDVLACDPAAGGSQPPPVLIAADQSWSGAPEMW